MPSLNVLLVEDDAVNRLFARAVLSKYGCTVTAVNNGAEGLDICRRQRFDALFMDCYMPLLDGFKTTEGIRALGGWASDVPIVALTASVTVTDRARATAAGMTGFLVKPIERALLRAELEKIARELRVRPQVG